jgi:hypothetical protein
MIGRYHLGQQRGDENTKIKYVLKKYDVALWIGFSWLRIMSSGGLL